MCVCVILSGCINVIAGIWDQNDATLWSKASSRRSSNVFLQLRPPTKKLNSQAVTRPCVKRGKRGRQNSAEATALFIYPWAYLGVKDSTPSQIIGEECKKLRHSSTESHTTPKSTTHKMFLWLHPCHSFFKFMDSLHPSNSVCQMLGNVSVACNHSVCSLLTNKNLSLVYSNQRRAGKHPSPRLRPIIVGAEAELPTEQTDDWPLP